MTDIENKSRCPFSREESIRNLGGMVWLYEKHLLKFKTLYANSAEEIRSDLQTGRIEDARLLAHSVKGLAGTLGLDSLYIASSYLERSIINEELRLGERLLYYETCLNEVIKSSDKE